MEYRLLTSVVMIVALCCHLEELNFVAVVQLYVFDELAAVKHIQTSMYCSDNRALSLFSADDLILKRQFKEESSPLQLYLKQV